jgi:putative tryptophan/tyrosine transport system substrate-binding protein
VAVLVHPSLAKDSMVRDVESAAQTPGLQVQVMGVGHPKEFERAFNRATQQGAGALLVPPAVLFALHQRQIAALAVKNRLPAIFYQRSFVEAGGLMAYGPRLSDLWRRVAVQVDRILKGTKPRDLPVQQP